MYKFRCAFDAHSCDVRGVALCEDEIVTVSNDGTGRLWVPNGHSVLKTNLKMNYKFRCAFDAHSCDVRGVALCEDEIVTVSNDGTGRLWVPNGHSVLKNNLKIMYKFRCAFDAHSCDVSNDGTGRLWVPNGNVYESVMTYIGHKKFVTSVCILPPSAEYGHGLIVTGGQDGKILGFDPFKSSPLFEFEAHSLCVCSLARTLENPQYFLSASWEGNAHLWDAVTQQPLSTFTGHSQAVWCIIQVPDESTVITGSADCTIKLYRSIGVLIATLKGHKDCVRDIVYIGNGFIASCSNDGTIRKWNIKRKTCSQIINASKSYIYSISALVTQKSDIFAFGGEDKCFGIQTCGEKMQEIDQPAQSVWTSAVMGNDDVVVGCSDGFVRIFTCDPSRQADEDEMLAYEREVNKLACLSSRASTPVDIDTIPGKEALLVPGKNDGDTMIIREGNCIVSYIWNQDRTDWRKVSNSDSEESVKESEPSSKVLYQGQEYDFVFDVEVSEGLDPLRLPYNLGDDPVEVARQFIKDYNLSPMYLEEITDFLIKNALAASENMPGTSFEAFIPKQESLKVVCSEPVYPLKQMVFFESFDSAAVYKKLEEFWLRVNYDNKHGRDVLDCIKSLHKYDVDYEKTDKAIPCLLDCMSKWSEDIVFPILDVLRIVFLRCTLHTYLFSRVYARSIFETLDKRFMAIETLPINKMFVFRIMTNLLCQKEGQDFLFENKMQILPNLKRLVTDAPHKGLEIAASTFVLDLSFLGCREDDIIVVNLCLQFIEHAIYKVRQNEAKFRLCVAVGTIFLRHGENILSIAIINKLKEMAALRETEKVSFKAISCARNIVNSLKNH